MVQALTLAQSAIGLTEPNPRVGCVILSADGQVLGQGHTQAAGQAHAEVMALRDAQRAGADVRGATAYVTLEPCSHHGRTGPCCEALISAGLQRAVVAMADPNPLVGGQGLQRLRAAGVQVDMAPTDLAEQARELNIGFVSRMERGRPWLRLKVAASLDGRSALDNGVSQWITGLEARTDGHAWRRRAGVVLSGAGTVLEDNPRLDVRLVPTAQQPLRVIIDARLQTPPTARLFEVDSPLLFLAGAPAPERAAALQARGAEVMYLPDGRGKVDLASALAELGRRQVNEVHLEAGERLNASWLRSGLVDELLVYLAPMLIGAGRGMAALGPLTELGSAPRFAFHDMKMVGADLRLLARALVAPPA
jgi:diaminohydroxyphosphoribosylaminopyrimidine deaminase/5-amino-6-(5-phosphoribosylamino)uracil reductase